jgi:hypothetical protein
MLVEVHVHMRVRVCVLDSVCACHMGPSLWSLARVSWVPLSPMCCARYKSFAKARVVRDKWSRKSKGYGFVSFVDAFDAAQAMREMQGVRGRV